jgi:hypothetical protein
LLVLVLTAALCSFVAVGCGGGDGEGVATPNPTQAEAERTNATPAREKAPVIEGISVDGEPISLADYRGRAVLINVWSSW